MKVKRSNGWKSKKGQYKTCGPTPSPATEPTPVPTSKATPLPTSRPTPNPSMSPTQVGETYPPSQEPSLMPSMMPTVGIAQGLIAINISVIGTTQEQQVLVQNLTSFFAEYGKYMYLLPLPTFLDIYILIHYLRS